MKVETNLKNHNDDKVKSAEAYLNALKGTRDEIKVREITEDKKIYFSFNGQKDGIINDFQSILNNSDQLEKIVVHAIKKNSTINYNEKPNGVEENQKSSADIEAVLKYIGKEFLEKTISKEFWKEERINLENYTFTEGEGRTVTIKYENKNKNKVNKEASNFEIIGQALQSGNLVNILEKLETPIMEIDNNNIASNSKFYKIGEKVTKNAQSGNWQIQAKLSYGNSLGKFAAKFYIGAPIISKIFTENGEFIEVDLPHLQYYVGKTLETCVLGRPTVEKDKFNSVIFPKSNPKNEEESSNLENELSNSVHFVVDSSSSMENEIEQVKDNLKNFIKKLGNQTNCKIMLTEFNSEVKDTIEVNSISNIYHKISQIEATGCTALYSAVEKAVEDVKTHKEEYIHSTIVILTDGMNNKGDDSVLNKIGTELNNLRNEEKDLTIYFMGYKKYDINLETKLKQFGVYIINLDKNNIGEQLNQFTKHLENIGVDSTVLKFIIDAQEYYEHAKNDQITIGNHVVSIGDEFTMGGDEYYIGRKDNTSSVLGDVPYLDSNDMQS